MPTFQFDGKTFEYNEGFYVCTIGGVAFNDNTLFWAHPAFKVSAEAAGHTLNTYADIVTLLNVLRVEINSEPEYSRYLNTLIADSGLFYRENSRSRWRLSFEELADLPVFRYVRHDEETASQTSDWVLFTDDVHHWNRQAVEPAVYTLHTLRMRRLGPTNHINVPTWTVRGTDGAGNVVSSRPNPMADLASYYVQRMNYTYKPPELTFLSHPRDTANDPLFFGMEVEVSTRITPTELQAIVTQHEPKQEPFFIMKSDSSISGSYDQMYEIVTMPCSPRYLKQEWRTLFKKLEELCSMKNMRITDVFDTRPSLSNGIHIHVSNDAFVQYSVHRHTHRNKFVSLWNGWDSEFQTWLQRITKRPVLPKDSGYCHVHPGLDGYTLARRIGRGPSSSDRHSACHVTPNTTELRVFQGVFSLDHILSCIELTQGALEYTANAPLSAMNHRAHQPLIEWFFKQNGYNHAKEALAQCA